MKAILVAILIILALSLAQSTKEKYSSDLWRNWIEYAGRIYGKKIRIYP